MRTVSQHITIHMGFGLLIVACIAGGLAPRVARAQEPMTPGAEVSELMAKLQQGIVPPLRIIRSVFQAERKVNGRTVQAGKAALYTDAARVQLLDALEGLAREGAQTGDAVTDSRARREAFLALSSIARDAYETSPQAQQVPARLMRIYRETNIEESKWSAIRHLGDMLPVFSKESPEIVQLLFSIIKQPVITRQDLIHGRVQHATKPVDPRQALDALIWACEAGMPSLRRLYAERDEINDDETRARIERIARQGFDLDKMQVSTGWPDPCG